jgi:hypothetical protein
VRFVTALAAGALWLAGSAAVIIAASVVAHADQSSLGFWIVEGLIAGAVFLAFFLKVHRKPLLGQIGAILFVAFASLPSALLIDSSVRGIQGIYDASRAERKLREIRPDLVYKGAECTGGSIWADGLTVYYRTEDSISQVVNSYRLKLPDWVEGRSQAGDTQGRQLHSTRNAGQVITIGNSLQKRGFTDIAIHLWR